LESLRMRQQLFQGVWRLSEATLPQLPPLRSRPRLSFQSIPSSTTPRFSFSMDAKLRAQVNKSQKPQSVMASAAAAKAQGQSAAEVPSVEGLSLHSTEEKSKFPNCYPSLNPFDIYRSHIAELLGEAAGLDPLAVFSKLQWTNTLEKGDLVLPVGALLLCTLVVYFLLEH
jgi:hypothetical protein